MAYKENATEGAVYQRAWVKTEKGRQYAERQKGVAKDWRKNNPRRAKANVKRAHLALKKECFSHYTSSGRLECKCCTESNIAFLELDHVDGDGKQHREWLQKVTGTKMLGGPHLHYWLKRNGYPQVPRLQILCSNCNKSKNKFKYCAHEIERGIDMHGDPIPDDFYPPDPMPVRKGPERTAWLESPEGLAFREKQALAHLGTTTAKLIPRIEVPCTECGAVLVREQREIDNARNKDGEARFFCSQKCAGAWKRKNLTGAKVYNFIPVPDPIIKGEVPNGVELECNHCHETFVRKRWEVRRPEKSAKHVLTFCGRNCFDAFRAKH